MTSKTASDRLRDALRNAKSDSEARAIFAHLSSGETLAEFAKQVDAAPEIPASVERARFHPVIRFVLPTIGFILHGSPIILQVARDTGFFGVVPQIPSPGSTLLILAGSTCFYIHIFCDVRYNRARKRRLSAMPFLRLPDLVIETARKAKDSYSAAPLLTLHEIWRTTPSADQRVAKVLRETLLRLLPKVTPGDASAFTVENVRQLRALAVGRLDDENNDSDADTELAVAAWLALATLAESPLPIPETLAADSERIRNNETLPQSVRAAAQEANEALKLSPRS